MRKDVFFLVFLTGDGPTYSVSTDTVPFSRKGAMYIVSTYDVLLVFCNGAMYSVSTDDVFFVVSLNGHNV